ncbi:MAG: radical SAM protein, partial [Desulfotignum sp.]|nr:radical SAM protein [Desulfotignum sp.]
MTIDQYRFETGMYRPPSEGGSASLLVRFTRNCPWNHCTFCSMYKTEKFSLRTVEEIQADINAMAALTEKMKTLSKAAGG